MWEIAGTDKLRKQVIKTISNENYYQKRVISLLILGHVSTISVDLVPIPTAMQGRITPNAKDSQLYATTNISLRW